MEDALERFRISSRIICISGSEWRVVVLASPSDGGSPLQLIDEADRADDAIDVEKRLRRIMAHRLGASGHAVEMLA